MKPDQQSCANRACPDFGKSGTDNIKVYSHKERRYYCLSCGKTFSESRASVFYHLRTHRQAFLEAIGCWPNVIVCAASLASKESNPIQCSIGWR